MDGARTVTRYERGGRGTGQQNPGVVERQGPHPVIARDRELLTRLAQVNASVGEVALELMAAQDGGELPAGGLLRVGEALCALGEDMIARAHELNAADTVVVGAP